MAPGDDTDEPGGSMQRPGRLEVFVEPFEEARPGPHVSAAVEAMEATGVRVDLDALASTVDAPVDELVTAAAAMLRAAFEHGATAVQLRVETDRPG